MNVIILAAGQGSRLKPLTNDKPKCLVELFGKTIIESQINIFKKCGIKDISIVTGYKKELIYFPDIHFFNNNKFESTNMLETLFCARKKFNKSIIISYGDIIFEEHVLQELLDSEDEISVIVDKNWKNFWESRFSNVLEDAESMDIDQHGFVRNIGQKVKNTNEICGQYIGLMKFSGNGLKSMIEFYDEVKKISKISSNPLNGKLPFEKSFMTDFLQGLINKGNKIKSIPIHGGWLELDTMTDFNLYNELYKDRTLSQFYKLN